MTRSAYTTQTIDPYESEDYLEKEIRIVYDAKTALDRFVYFYQKYKAEETLEDEQDKISFQYGYFELEKKRKNRDFEINFSRQFHLPNDEFLLLNLTMYYPTDGLGDIEEDRFWSTEFNDLNEWVEAVKASEGFKQIEKQRPERVEIELDIT